MSTSMLACCCAKVAPSQSSGDPLTNRRNKRNTPLQRASSWMTTYVVRLTVKLILTLQLGMIPLLILADFIRIVSSAIKNVVVSV